MSMLGNKRVLLIVTGGIAAFKALELVRLIRANGINVRVVLTASGSEFVTPLSIQALTEDKVYTELFSLTDESEMGHIQLSRDADLILVAPATANILAKMRAGISDDLASTVLLATDKPVLVAPSMNVRMWEHPATQENIDVLLQRGVKFLGPAEGEMACGEFGSGRMSEPVEIVQHVLNFLSFNKALEGKTALVTSGPTLEPIDPVRFISNRSSGKQGYAIASILSQYGAKTTLVTGPTNLTDPPGVNTIKIETAADMLQACLDSLPVDIAICAAAVADWHVVCSSEQKLKKHYNSSIPNLKLNENPAWQAILDAKGNGRKEQDTLNFSAGINKGNLSLTLWGKNITDDEFLVSVFPAVADPTSTSFFGYPNAFKSYGVTLNYSF